MSESSTNPNSDDVNNDAEDVQVSEQAKQASLNILSQYVDQFLSSTTEEERADAKQQAVEAAYTQAHIIDGNITRTVINRQWGALIMNRTRPQSRAAEPVPEPVEEQTQEPAAADAVQPEPAPRVARAQKPPTKEDVLLQTVSRLQKEVTDLRNERRVEITQQNDEEPESLPKLVRGASAEVKQAYMRTIQPQFDAILEKVFMDDYRRAMFYAWKAAYNYEGDLGDFLVDAFDEYMMLRGLDLQLVQNNEHSLMALYASGVMNVLYSSGVPR